MLKKPKILFVGEDPNGYSGNSHMLAEMLRRVNKEDFLVNAFVVKTGAVDFSKEREEGVKFVEGSDNAGDIFCSANLIHLLASFTDLSALVFVGIDMWRYVCIFPQLIAAKSSMKFKWVSIFPYDLIFLKNDWLKFLEPVDYPCVYSKYGYDMLKEEVPNLRYFRPALYETEKFSKYSEEYKRSLRKAFFNIDDDVFLIGYFGMNQHRKDPQRLLYAFAEYLKENQDSTKKPVLYIHTELTGVFNLQSFMNDLGLKTGDMFVKKQNFNYPTDSLVSIYNCMDAYISVSLQEGLNWTVVEAMLCGLPIAASYNTAHKELLDDSLQIKINCTDLSYIPMYDTWMPSKACNVEDIKNSFSYMMIDTNIKSEDSLLRGKEWIEKVDDINLLLEEVITVKENIEKNKKTDILFVQHSSAGDVLMSTQCFKGIKERHKGKKLIYMTQRQYKDIVTNNPYIDEIVEWDDSLIDEYDIVYNPHGDKILPGGWNNLDVTLHSMYPYFCKVEPNNIFIESKVPNENIVKQIKELGDYIVVHTSGASDYRRYPHMDIVLQQLKIKSVQVGGKYDVPCARASLDLREHLSFRETAWVMKEAKLVIAIDSFPAHLAGALKVPAVILFGPAPARVTQPRADKDKLICLQPNMLDACKVLSHCWGAPPIGKLACTMPCINTIHPLEIVKAAKQLLRGN